MNAAHNHSLFFAPNNNSKDFGTVLREVQEYISSKYSTLILDGGKDEVKTQVKRYISKYLMDCRIAVKGMTDQQLVDALYTEMVEFSFLTKYIFGAGIEEIDINSWRDIEVQYSDGRTVKLEEYKASLAEQQKMLEDAERLAAEKPKRQQPMGKQRAKKQSGSSGQSGAPGSSGPAGASGGPKNKS